MNFALMISCKIEEKLAAIDRGGFWTQAKEAREYDRCLKEVVEEDGRAWADGNIRVGDYILLSKSSFKLCNPFLTAQLIPTPASRPTVFSMLRRKWSGLPRSGYCSFLPVSCKLLAITSKTASPSSPI